MKKFFCLILFLLVTIPVFAGNTLAPDEIQRLTKAKSLLADTEDRSVNELVLKFQKTGWPEDYLAIYEAIAFTFRDITKDYKNDRVARVRLLDKIRMNMAYFQFGGSRAEQEGSSELNRLIQRKLKQYLPEDIWFNPAIFHSLE